MILRPPATISGHPKLESPSIYPAISGLTADARLRGTDVTLAAAARSAGATTAITYELRVGTSICDSALRASNSATAHERLDANGTSSSRTLDGKCVNTIVLTRPNRFAMRVAAR